MVCMAAHPIRLRPESASAPTRLPVIWARPAGRVRRDSGRRCGRLAGQASAADFAADELLYRLAGDVVAVLLGRRLHEVGRGRDDRAADAAVLGDLGGADRVDDHAGRVRRVPDLELVLQVQRGVAERLALQPHVGPLAVVQPRHVVRRADVHVGLGHLMRDLRGDRLGLGDLLGLQALALQHVHEVHVAAEVELVGAQQLDAAVLEQLGHHTVRDRRADLGLDVVADDRHAPLGGLGRPRRDGGNKDRQRVDERHARLDRALGVELVGLLRANRQIRDEHVGLRVLEYTGNVDRLLVRLGDDLAVVLAEAVVGRAALDSDAGRRHVADSDRVVLAGHDRLGDVPADLLGIHVEGGDELDVPDAHDGYTYRTHTNVLLILYSSSAEATQAGRSVSFSAVSFSAVSCVAPELARRGRVRPPLGGDQFVQPADLALDRLQAVPLQLEGVAVDPLPGP